MVAINEEVNKIVQETKNYLDNLTFTIIKAFADKDTFTEKEIKKIVEQELNIKIKSAEVRKILYKLEDLGIVYPIEAITLAPNKFDYKWGNKVKDLYKIYQIILNKQDEKIDEIEKQMPKTLYYCEECKIYYTFDEAVDNDFKCKECGSLLMENNNIYLKRLEDLKINYKKFLDNIKKHKKIAKASLRK